MYSQRNTDIRSKLMRFKPNKKKSNKTYKHINEWQNYVKKDGRTQHSSKAMTRGKMPTVETTEENGENELATGNT